MKNFGIILKDASINLLPRIADKFDDCYVVNYQEKELLKFEKYLKGKNIIHFVNRRGTIRMSKEIYRRFNITTIQYNLPEFVSGYFRKQRIPKVPTIQVDKKTQKRIREYSEFDLKFQWLPEKVLFWHKDFEPYENHPGEYLFKHPNTGVQACITAAEVIKPEHIYVVGLGFYQVGYLYRREVCNDIKTQQKKIKRCHIIEHFEKVLSYYNNIKWTIGTTYRNLKHGDHVEILLYEGPEREKIYRENRK